MSKGTVVRIIGGKCNGKIGVVKRVKRRHIEVRVNGKTAFLRETQVRVLI